MKIFAYLSILAVLGLSACATRAQRQFSATNEAAKVAFENGKQCQSSLNENVAYSELEKHLALAPTPPATLEQLADTATPSNEDVAAILQWHKGAQVCRQQLMDAAQASFPFMVPAFQQNWLNSDAVYLRLAQRKISFGEANRQLAQARLDGGVRIRQAAGAWTAGLREEHREEMAARQAAFQAIANGIQQQELINAINKPVTTSCNQIGTFTNCTTR